jgi:hypothetical protein
MKKIVVVILIICSSCSNKYSDGVQKALKLAGKNSSELESVLHNYQEPKDSLKLKAACFLIENML